MTLRTPGRPLRRGPATRLLAAVLVAAVSAVLGGCAAGQRAQTANEYSVVDGTSADVGSMGLRDAGLTPPPSAAGYDKGASATLSLTVVNSGNSADTLVSVSTPNAARTTITAPTPTAASSTTATATTGLSVPAQSSVVVGAGAGAGRITLADLTGRLTPGQLVTVTLKFRVAGQVAVQLPVKLVPEQTGGPTVQVSPPAPSGV